MDHQLFFKHLRLHEVETWTDLHQSAPRDPSDPSLVVLGEGPTVWDVPPGGVRGRDFPQKLCLNFGHRLRPLSGWGRGLPSSAPWLQVLVAAATCERQRDH